MRGWLIFSIVLTACATSTPVGGSSDVAAIAIDSWTHDGKDSAGDADDATVASCQIGAACTKHSDFGTCAGTVTACKNGEPSCSAPAPTAESCNGVDDDCNGVTDDNLCEDGDPCTVGYCKVGQCAQKALCDDGDACTAETCSAGKCSYSPGPMGCTIGGACVSAGSKDPQNSCRVCNPLQSKTDYVSQKGLACDDGDACTTGDVCTDGKCQGVAVDCSKASSACGIATCVGGKCVTAGTAGVCQPGAIAACAEPCEENVCGKDCQWQGCALKAGAVCAWKSGTNHQCCAPGSWQFCSKTTCNWYACQADSQSGCP